MKGLFRTIPPFAPDSVGAMAAFADVSCLVICCDLNGTVAAYRQRVEFGPGSPLKAESALGVRELSYVMGHEGAFVDDCLRVLERHDVDLVVLVHGPCTAMMGLDLGFIASSLEDATGVSCLAVDSTGNGCYDEGLSSAMIAVYRRMASPRGLVGLRFAREGRAGSDGPDEAGSQAEGSGLCVAGINRCDHASSETRDAYAQAISRALGQPVVSSWGCGPGMDSWTRAEAASTVVVASASAQRVARSLQGLTGAQLMFADELDLRLCDDDIAGRLQRGAAGKRLLIVHEQMTANVVRRILMGAGGPSEPEAHDGSCTVASFFSMVSGRMAGHDVRLRSENDFAALVRDGGFDAVFGDPCLKPLVPDGVPLVAFPHCALSDDRARWGRTCAEPLTTSWFESVSERLQQ